MNMHWVNYVVGSRYVTLQHHLISISCYLLNARNRVALGMSPNNFIVFAILFIALCSAASTSLARRLHFVLKYFSIIP